MLPPDKIMKDLLGIVEGVRNPPAILNFLPVLPQSRDRFDALTERCIALHKDVAALPPDAETWEHSQRLFNLEAEYKRLRAKLMLMPAVLLIYLGFSLLVALLSFVNITGFVKDVLKVDAPEKLMTFGIAGAFLYLATTLLAGFNAPGSAKDPIVKVADFTVRILLAIVVPILLVSLFFTPTGAVGEVKMSPELVAFACGYSAKLVVEIFNKIVEKGSKMIEAL